MKIITRALSGVALGVGLLSAEPAGTGLVEATGKAIPSVAAPGTDVVIFVRCETEAAAAAVLFGTTLGLPARIPMTRARTAGSFDANVTVPPGTVPGHFKLGIDCADGSSATVGLTVATSAGRHTGNGGLALTERGRAERREAGPTHTGQMVGWALAGGVLIGGLVAALMVRRRRDRSP